MPSLGADMERGTVLEWLVKPGDVVRKGDVVAVVDTSKAAIEVECFVGGTIEKILVEPGSEVPVGTVLATIESGVAAEPAERAEPAGAAPAEVGPAPASPPAVPEAPAAAARHLPVDVERLHSPLVRRLARELKVDVATLTGTGPAGRVTRADVVRAATPVRRRVSPYARRLAAELGVNLEQVTAGDDGVIHAVHVRAAQSRTAAIPAGAPAAEPVAAAQRQAMRAAIAALMARSKREIPHYYLSATVDLSRGMAWLRDRNRDLPVSQRLVPAALMLKASALAARKVPQLNGFWVDGEFHAAGSVHLGVAVSLREGGLLAPAIHDAPDRSLDELMTALRDLVARARTGRLRGSEMSDPTITVTNLGEQGVESVLGVIYPPQVALVGFGKVVERPFAVDGLLGVRPLVTVTLAADHRATDGYTGARFLNTIDKLLQHPEAL